MGTPGAVRVSGGRNLAFVSCAFRHLGASGLQLADCSQHVNVSSWVFDDISGHGLVLGQIDDGNEPSPAEHNAHLSVINNTIRHTPSEFHGCNAIWAGYLRGANIRNNDIRNCTHSAIAIGWGWHFSGYSQHNIVAANRIVLEVAMAASQLGSISPCRYASPARDQLRGSASKNAEFHSSLSLRGTRGPKRLNRRLPVEHRGSSIICTGSINGSTGCPGLER